MIKLTSYSSSPNDITYPSTDYGLGEHLSSNEATAAVTIADLIETSVRKQVVFQKVC